MPSDLEEYFESLMAATIFLSNFYFWDQSGYFDSSAELKPLLHTWSLAVEEQYYIIFPLILSFIWRFGRRVMLWSVWLLLIFSILIAQYQVNTSQVSAFFLLPSRGWELLAGALVATANFNGKERFSRWTRELYAVAGFVMISVCMILYDQDTDFPGSRAVPVVFGTVLIILFATKDQIVGRILSKKPLVAIGLISYSLYLWHQPIFALFKYRFGYDKFDIFMPTLIVLSVVIAIFSYFAVERPFRRNATARQVCCSTAAFAMFTLIVAAWGDNIIDTDKTRAPAYQWALNAASAELLELIERKNTRMKCANVASGFGFNYCEIGIQKPNPDFVLWGDSLAGALLHGLNIAAKQREISGIAFVANGCPPVIGLQNTMAKDCTGDTHKEIFKRILEFPELKLVFLTGNFSGAMSAGNVRIYGQPTSTDSVIEQVSSTLQELRSLGTTTVIVEQGPLFSEPVAENILLDSTT